MSPNDVMSEFRAAMEKLYSPMDEVEKTSRVILGLSTGASALLAAALRDALPRGLARLFFNLALGAFAISILAWFVVSIYMLFLRTRLVKALHEARNIERLEEWAATHDAGLNEAQRAVVYSFLSQAGLFILGVIGSVLFVQFYMFK